MSTLNPEQLQAVNSNSDRILCLAGAGAGKALRNGTKVKTPSGDIAIEQLHVGDMVFASDGIAYHVLGVYPQGKKQVVRISFSDDTSIDCSEDHLWIYQTKSMRDHHKGFDVKTANELSGLPLKKKSGSGFANNLYIPMCESCQYIRQDVPIDPYLLGLLIGDGGLNGGGIRFSNTESDILEYVQKCVADYGCQLVKYDDINYGITNPEFKRTQPNILWNHIKNLGLNCKSIDKHIPDVYKYNTEEVRLSILAGLIDTDGWVSHSTYEYSTTSLQLATDTAELVESLGMTCKVVSNNSHYIYKGNKVDLDHKNYRLHIKPSSKYDILHKSNKHSVLWNRSGHQNFARRYITDISYLDVSDDMTCISVDSPDHSFLTEHYIVTHNTKTMLDRISRLVEDGNTPSSIMALTFTNAAAAEMKTRYENAHADKETPEFRTFHSFCYSLICKDPNVRSALGYDSVPNIATDDQEKEIEEKAKAQCKVTLPKERLKNRIGLTKKEQFQADLYDKAVDRMMRSENIITFDKLNSRVAELFASDDISTHIYKNKYRFIFVDEFQDTDNYQIKFLNSFTTTNFYFCGDTLQEIYRFRGTSNEYIKALANTPGWEKIRLFTNYRSTNQICEYANKFSKKYADASYRIEMQGIRDGERVITKLIDPPNRYTMVDPKHIEDVLKEMDNLSGTSAILCRTNKEVYAVTDYLKAHSIKFVTNKDTKIHRLIDCAMSDTYAIGWLASYLSSTKYGEYIRLSSQTENPDLEWFLKLYGTNASIKADVKSIQLLQEIANSGKFTNAKLLDIEEQFGVPAIAKTDEQYSGNKFLQYLKGAISDIRTSELYVGTIHSVKGLEYDNVFVMNVGAYCFQLNTEDEKNLFYVAVTRAKNRLFIYELFDEF